ncbi:MAG: hypothetical protein H0U99_00965 [Chthoniobacterales bacterium]|nr:hypothetical protein [Chthoniobacterales bacterium]
MEAALFCRSEVRDSRALKLVSKIDFGQGFVVAGIGDPGYSLAIRWAESVLRQPQIAVTEF